MANRRVTSDEVLEIIDTDLTNITPFISAANIIVTDRLGSAGIGSELLKEIERWLAAHFLAVREPNVKSETVGGASATYETSVLGKRLEGTSYGQQVLILDPTGSLAQLGKKKASFSAVDWDDWT